MLVQGSWSQDPRGSLLPGGCGRAQVCSLPVLPSPFCLPIRTPLPTFLHFRKEHLLYAEQLNNFLKMILTTLQYSSLCVCN